MGRCRGYKKEQNEKCCYARIAVDNFILAQPSILPDIDTYIGAMRAPTALSQQASAGPTR